MGFFDWIMKGMGFDAEDGDETTQADKVPKLSRRERKRLEKEAKEKERQKVLLAQQEVSANIEEEKKNPYSQNPDQFNIGSYTYNDDVNSYSSYGGKNVVIYKPKDYHEVQKLIDFLKQGESAVIDLCNLGDDEAQRVLDYVSGAVYALNGSTHRIAGSIFLLTPEGLNIMIPKKDS